MKLEKYIKVIKDKNYYILSNSLNRCIVSVNEDRIKDRDLLMEKFTSQEIVFLENNGFIQDNSYKYFNKSKRDFTTITINITENCNINCLYCYQNDSKINNGKIDLEVINKITNYIEYLAMQGRKKFYIYFFGGEPLLYKDKIYSIKDNIDELSSKYLLDVKYGLGSNCLLLDDYFLERFNNLDIDTTLSLKLDHNYLRSGRYFKNTFYLILDNIINAYEKYNCNIHIGYNVHNNNIKDFDKFLDLLVDKGLTNIKVSCDYIDNYDYNILFNNSLKYEDFLKWKSSEAIDSLIDHKFNIYGSPFFPYEILCDAYDKESIKFFSDGSIGYCNFTKFENRIKNLNNPDMILKNKIDFLTKNKFSKSSNTCRECNHIGVCRGKIYCNNELCKVNNDYDYTEFIKEYIKHSKKGNGRFFVDM